MDQDWWRVTGLEPARVPELLVVEGSWWRRDREAQRLGHLDGVYELCAPDWWWGRWRGHAVVYACVYGAARVVEPVHVLGQLGTAAVAQIGSCGGLQPGVRPGDLIVADRVRVAEGASAHYGGGGWAYATRALVDRAVGLASVRGLTVHRGESVTTEVLLRQPPELVRSWSEAGYLGVDMESSATLSAAAWAGMRGVALLHAWDELLAGRSWTEELPAEDATRRAATEAALFELALETCLSP
jgi:purine-nucleoside phosphorylase